MVASGAVGLSPAAGVPTPRPAARVLGRPRALGDSRRAQTLPPRAPAAPPRSPWSPPPASLHPSRAQPAGSRACPTLPCPPRSSIPPKDKAASNLAHSSPDTLPALFARCTLVFLPLFFQFIRAWRFFPAGSTLSPSLQEQIWGTGGREQQESPSCLQGLRTETHQVLAPLLPLFCPQGENRALRVGGSRIATR